MKILFYNTSSSNNTINKVLVDETQYEIKLKDNTDIINPMIVLRSDDIILFNYAYIPKFGRYYFVEKIELYPNSIYYIYLRCDVLESYKDDILKCDANIRQQKQNVNSYYDSDYKTEIRKEVEIYEPEEVNYVIGSSMILSTIGG